MRRFSVGSFFDGAWYHAMDERDFLNRADAQLAAIETALESLLAAGELDFDIEMKPGGVMELEFEDGSKIIVNRHAAAREIWLAARSGGFHFRWDGAHWVGTRDGKELLAALSGCMSEQSGQPVSLG
jgi:CyaY protein